MIVSKECARCEVRKPLSEFYIRSGYGTPDNPATIPGHYVSECKQCMKDRSRLRVPFDAKEPLIKGEKLAIEYLAMNNIPALPGKAVSHAWTDIVAFGCIGVEVKHAKLKLKRGVDKFTFMATPQQQKNGFRGAIVMLICEYPDRLTYHLFRSTEPVFYMGNRVKSGFDFTPGNDIPLKHGNNRVVMTQPMMDKAQDNTQLIWECLKEYQNSM